MRIGSSVATSLRPRRACVAWRTCARKWCDGWRLRRPMRRDPNELSGCLGHAERDSPALVGATSADLHAMFHVFQLFAAHCAGFADFGAGAAYLVVQFRLHEHALRRGAAKLRGAEHERDMVRVGMTAA